MSNYLEDRREEDDDDYMVKDLRYIELEELIYYSGEYYQEGYDY